MGSLKGSFVGKVDLYFIITKQVLENIGLSIYLLIITANFGQLNL